MTAAAVLAGDARWCVVEGDAAEVLATLPAASVHAVVTDPPSGIAFMGAEWDRDKGGRAAWCAWLAGILAQARAATVPGGRTFVWSLPRTSHWTGCAVEDAGWSIETTVQHLFGTGWPKGKSQLKPAAETWWLARTGPSLPLSVDACRVGADSTRRENRAPMGYMGNEPAGDGYVTGSDAGRWPPNAVFSHGPGCVREGVRRVRGTALHGAPTRGTVGTATSVYDGGAKPQGTVDYADPDGTEAVEAWRCSQGCVVAALDAQAGERTSGDVMPPEYADAAATPSRFFPQFEADDPAEVFRYVAKPSRAEKNAGCEDLAQSDGASVAPVASGKVMRCAECRRTHPVAYHGACVRCGGAVALDDAANDGSGRDGCATKANAHPTVKPLALMRWLIRLVTKPGDIVLDPFGGSGTTGAAALLEGRRVILVERDPRYAEIARARLQHAAPTRDRLATMATAPVRVEAPDFGPLFGGAR